MNFVTRGAEFWRLGEIAMGNASNASVRTSLILLGSLAFSVTSPALAQSAGDVIPNSFICVFKPGPITVTYEAHSSAAKVGGQITHIYQNALHGFSVTMAESAVAQLMRINPLIDYCEQDRIASIPPGDDVPSSIARGKPGGGGGGGGGSTQTLPWGVDRLHGPGDGSGKTAWVIDSGIDTTHPDLNVDISRSVSFLSRDSSYSDANGHGTHVAGIIGARNNGFGVVGVAANATLVSLRVLDRRGNGPDSGVIAAIDWAADHAAPGDVINLSLITTLLQSMNDAVANVASKGIYVAIAAGNNADDASNYSPASAAGPNVYTVSAFQNGDIWASFSNYGPPVTFSEPGVSIYSTYKGGGYTTLSGTSMAAPHLAGLLLLNGVNFGQEGPVSGDPDGQPDPIAVVK